MLRLNQKTLPLLSLLLGLLFSTLNCADGEKKQRKTAFSQQGSDASPRTIVSFTASPSVIPKDYEGKVTLKWQTTGIKQEISLSEIGLVEPNGFRIIEAPTEAKEYILSVPGDASSETIEQKVQLTLEAETAPLTANIGEISPPEIKLPTLGAFVATEQVIENLDATKIYRFDFGDFNNDGILDLYALKTSTAPEQSTMTILDGAQNFSVPLMDNGNLNRSWGSGQNYNFYAYDHDHDTTKSADFMFIKKANTGTQKVEVFSFSSHTETLGDFQLATGSAASPVATDITGALIKTPDPQNLPNILLIGKNLDGDGTYRYRILDGRVKCDTIACSDNSTVFFQGFLFPSAEAPGEPLKFVDANSLYKFITHDFNHDGTSDLIVVRLKGSENKIIEFSVFDGVSLFRKRILEVATQIAEQDNADNIYFNTYQDSIAFFIFSLANNKWTVTIYKL